MKIDEKEKKDQSSKKTNLQKQRNSRCHLKWFRHLQKKFIIVSAFNFIFKSWKKVIFRENTNQFSYFKIFEWVKRFCCAQHILFFSNIANGIYCTKIGNNRELTFCEIHWNWKRKKSETWKWIRKKNYLWFCDFNRNKNIKLKFFNLIKTKNRNHEIMLFYWNQKTGNTYN